MWGVFYVVLFSKLLAFEDINIVKVVSHQMRKLANAAPLRCMILTIPYMVSIYTNPAELLFITSRMQPLVLRVSAKILKSLTLHDIHDDEIVMLNSVEFSVLAGLSIKNVKGLISPNILKNIVYMTIDSCDFANVVHGITEPLNELILSNIIYTDSVPILKKIKCLNLHLCNFTPDMINVIKCLDMDYLNSLSIVCEGNNKVRIMQQLAGAGIKELYDRAFDGNWSSDIYMFPKLVVLYLNMNKIRTLYMKNNRLPELSLMNLDDTRVSLSNMDQLRILRLHTRSSRNNTIYVDIRRVAIEMIYVRSSDPFHNVIQILVEKDQRVPKITMGDYHNTVIFTV